MTAIAADADWPLSFSLVHDGRAETRLLRWAGAETEIACGVFDRVRARELWAATMNAAYDTVEPGVLFVDRINRLNNLHYRENITSTNPCGEIPLPPYGACVVGSINLTAFVVRPFSSTAALQFDATDRVAADATRL